MPRHHPLRQHRRLIWHPLLQGAPRQRALDCAAAIGEALARPGEAPEDGPDEAASLAGGAAGQAVLFAYLAQTGLAGAAEELAVARMERAGDIVSEVALDPSLYSGYAGVGWAMAHLEGRLFEPSEEDSGGAVDEALLEVLQGPAWRDDYDLISGLVGFGVYALERLPRPGAHGVLERVVDLLGATAERSGGMATWFTPPDLLVPWQRAECPDGYYNLGLAHGVPGVIAFLAGALGAGVRSAEVRELLDGAVPWLLARRRPDDGGSCFTTWFGPGVERGSSRAAWCYGDPGVAMALVLAAAVADEPRWREAGLSVAHSVARRPAQRCGVADAGLCHGAAGLALVLHRLHHLTGDGELGEAAARWYLAALEMRREGQGIAGFTTLDISGDGTRREIADPSLLTGAAGIALALLAASTPIEPEWDRMLLLSLKRPEATGQPRRGFPRPLPA